MHLEDHGPLRLGAVGDEDTCPQRSGVTGFPLEMLPVQLGGMCEARRAQGEKLGLGPGGEAGVRAWGEKLGQGPGQGEKLGCPQGSYIRDDLCRDGGGRRSQGRSMTAERRAWWM